MAQLPTIASTAARRIAPSADLRVDGVSPAAFGAAVGAGLQQVGEAGAEAVKAMQQFELVKQQEANRLAEFDRQTQFVAFGSDQATKLEEQSRDLTGPAQDFTKTFMGGFDADAAAFLEKVPERDRPAWQARMAQLRAGVSAGALKTEFAQRDSYYKTTLADTLGKLQNGAMSQPDKLADWMQQGEHVIAASGLSAQDKLDYTTKWKGAVAVAAAQGDIQRDPEGAMARLGGIDFIVSVGDGTPAAAGTISGSQQDAIRSAAKQLGVTPVELAALASYESAGTMKPSVTGGDGGRYVGIFQFGPEEQRRYGVSPKSSFEDQVKALVRFAKDRGYKPGMGWKKLYTTINAGNPNASVKAADSNGTQEDHYRQIEGTHFAKGRAFLGVQGEGGVSGEGTVVSRTVGTGEVDPRYADIPIDARVQLIGAAERQIDRREREVEAAEAQAHDEWLNTFMTDLVDGKAGREDIEAARKSGALKDVNEIVAALNIVEAREKETAALDFYNAATAGGGQLNPFDENAKKGAEAAFQQQVKVAGANPMQVAANIWQRSGVLPESGATMIRGALVSTDPNRVAAGASVAANMLQRNPNAFAGVQGGDQIEKAAALYSHYVNDLGMTAQDAAARVAQQNAPDVKRRLDVNKPQLDAFRADLRKRDVGNIMSNALGGWFVIDPDFTAPEQINAAAQDYADFALDHYEKNGDPAAAEAYAVQQMKKLYGAVDGRIMKFPPTRAYPPVGGSHNYIFEQAAADIQSVTGRKIDPKNIYLMPIPTATAQAFRAGRPVPYAVHYIDTVGGQKVYRALPGVAFTADVAAAQKGAGRKFQDRRDMQRLTQEVLNQPVPGGVW